MACIAGGIAQAYYKKIPPEIAKAAMKQLTPDLRKIFERFYLRFPGEY